jgi:hypothetical protein
MFDRVAFGKRVLLAGCGGGYDVRGAVPLWHALRADHEVHFASLSLSYLNGLDARQDTEVPNLYEVTEHAATQDAYCPEAHLAKFVGQPIWCFDKTGVRPLARAYRALIERLRIDHIMLVDGGIDAMLRGDELSLGTPSEDLASLAATTMQGFPVTLACVGMTSELRDGIAHAHVFERIAELTREGAYLGASALTTGDPATDAYVAAVEHVFAGQAGQKRSHVHKVIVSAIRGEFGPTAPHVWLSPLLNMFWFFDAHTVARTHKFLDLLAATDSVWEVTARIEGARKSLRIRDHSPIPV